MRLKFSDCVLDTVTLRLERQGTEVPVEPQVFDLIRHLALNAEKVVSKDDLIDAVWQGRIVSDATISSRINAARTALGDDGARQEIIHTVPRRGFEMRVPVSAEGDEAPVRKAAPARQRIRYATAPDGARLAWATSGEGPPLLRMSHHLSHLELDWNSRFWRPFFDRLQAHHTLIRYDSRGSGLSEPKTEGKTLEDFVADLEAVVAAAGLETFPILSTLQAVPVALRYVAENPGRVTRLVIQEGYARGRGMRPGAGYSAEGDPVVNLIRNGWGDPENGFMRGWVAMILPLAPPEDVNDMIGLVASVALPEHVIEGRLTIDQFSAEDVLEKVTAPTLIIHTRIDTIHPVAEARLMAERIPDAELLIVESSNTLCLPSDPTWEEQTSAIEEFLAG